MDEIDAAMAAYSNLVISAGKYHFVLYSSC
jgi:hypothetical protein